jgi:hypothetical protein
LKSFFARWSVEGFRRRPDAQPDQTSDKRDLGTPASSASRDALEARIHSA